MTATFSVERVIALMVLLTVVVTTEASGHYTETRNKRDVMGMGQMISTVTGKNIFVVLTSYNGYGCYCGIGGRGTPVDEVDGCCKTHDDCFTAAQKGVCAGTGRGYYSHTYKYRVTENDKPINGVHAEVVCAPVSAYKTRGQGRCGTAICKCDRNLSRCLAQHPSNRKHIRYDREKCHD